MRQLFFASILFAVSITGCKQKDGNTAASNSRFSAKNANDADLQKIKGIWLCKSVALKAKSGSEGGDAVFAAIKPKTENSILVFTPNQLFSTQQNQYALQSWAFQVPNQIKATSANQHLDFQIEALADSVLTLDYDVTFPESNKVAARITSSYAKIKDGDGISWLNPENHIWKTKPTSAEDRAAITKRVRSLVNHAYLYANAQLQNGAQNINTNQFRLPFEYYSGAVALQRENTADEAFTSLFYNAENAHIAFDVLRTAFKKVAYPKDGNFIQQYAEFFKGVGNAIE